MKRKQAFTLVELLCTLAVCSILLAVLLPVFSRAKLGVTKGACLERLRSVGQFIRMWRNDHDEDLPPTLQVALGINDTAYAAWERSGHPWPPNYKDWQVNCPLKGSMYLLVTSYGDFTNPEKNKFFGSEEIKWNKDYHDWLIGLERVVNKKGEIVLEASPIVYCTEDDHATGGSAGTDKHGDPAWKNDKKGRHAPALFLSGRVAIQPTRTELVVAIEEYYRENQKGK